MFSDTHGSLKSRFILTGRSIHAGAALSFFAAARAGTGSAVLAATEDKLVKDRALSPQLRQAAYDYGYQDASARADWQHSLEEHVWGKVLPDFSLEHKAVVLTEYGRGWRSAGRSLPPGHPVPERSELVR